VVARISVCGFKDLIRDTRSCTHVRGMTTQHPHCGLCSQCIDRRFAILAAGLEEEDPAGAYKIDLFTDERMPGPGRELALAYVRSASVIDRMTEVDFFSRYGEASRAVGFFDEPAATVAQRIFDLHRRHAAAVCQVFDQATSKNAARLRKGNLPPSSLLCLVLGQHEAEVAYPEPIRAADQPTASSPAIKMAIDGQRVVIDGWGEITGVSAALLIALTEPFRRATTEERAPANYPFILTNHLLDLLKCPEEETLRRRVHRCRSKIRALAGRVGETLPPDAVIESSQRYGYRLNPDSVRIVAITELTARK
jgi:hypothetical protein